VPFAVAWPLAVAAEAIGRMLRVRHPPPLTRYRVLHFARDYHFSIERARRVLGYEPGVGLDEAVCRTVAWYRHEYGTRTP
jgi:nucleoside-diphosphate-sugar epimerase